MTFPGFTQTDFNVFTVQGLEARMEGIQGHIQPKFKALGEELCGHISLLTGQEMFLHIAKHARRTVNAPVDTWMAVCDNKRGYKQHPHFQVGLFDDRVFVWLALIYELPNKQKIAQRYLKNIKQVREIIPQNYVISFDHMKKDAVAVNQLTKKKLTEALERFRDVKKAELLIGLNIVSGDPVLADGDAFVKLVKDTFTALAPLYQMACEI